MEYEIAKVVPVESEIDSILTLFEAAYPKATKFSREFVRWQYAENPAGKIIGYNAWFDDELAAHYVVMPIYMMIDGVKTKGALSLNTATHPDHQGKRLFTQLAAKTYELAAEQGCRFIIGVANANSTHGFLKHLEFELIAPLTMKMGIGNRIYDDKSYTFARCWDEETFAWRLRNPSMRYHQNGELIVSPIYPLFKKVLMHRKAIGLGRLHCRPFNLYIGLGANLKKGVYLNVPSFLEHSPFNLIWRDLTDGQLPKMTKDNVFFELIDFDVA